MSTSKFTEAWLKSKIRKLEIESVEQVASDIEKGARRNFNKAMPSVSTDDPEVDVMRIKEAPNKQTVICGGYQVLFIEFGVGLSNKFVKNGTDVAIGFDRNTATEVAPRPAKIDPLGHYHLSRWGRSQGIKEFWVRPSRDGIPNVAIGEQEVHTRNRHTGEITGVRDDVVWTQGHPPVRALWRARNNALAKLFKGGRIRRIG